MTDVVSQIEAVIAGIEARTDHDFGCAGASHICNCGRRVRVRSEIARTLERMVIAAAQTFQSATFGNQMAWQNDENAPQLNAMEVAWGGGVPGYPGTGDPKVTTMRQAFWRQVRKRPGVLYWHVVETVREWIRRARRDVWDSLPQVAAVLNAHQPTPHPEQRVIRCACGLEFHFIDAKAWHRHAAAMVMHVFDPMEPR